MNFKVKSPILGFEDIEEVKFIKIDELLAKIEVIGKDAITFSLVNPYALREYSFDLPANVQALMEITTETKVTVYNIIAVQNPAEASIVNFLAPIIFNEENHTCGQVVLQSSHYPDFGLAEPVKKYLSA